MHMLARSKASLTFLASLQLAHVQHLRERREPLALLSQPLSHQASPGGFYSSTSYDGDRIVLPSIIGKLGDRHSCLA